MSSKKSLLAAAVFLFTALAYLPGLSGGFLFDDYPNLVRNKAVQIDTLDADSLTAASLSFAGMLRRPMSMASFALNYYYFGPSPLSFKAVNILIHLLCGLTIYWLTSLLLVASKPASSPSDDQGARSWIPLAVTAIWLFHPMQVTSVLYIVQRMASLTTLFLLLGSCLYVSGRLRMLTGKQYGLAIAAVGVIGCTILALMNKENGAILPLLALVIEVSVFNFRSADGTRDRRIIAAFVAGLLVPAMAVAIWLVVNPDFFLSRYGLRDFTLSERLLTEGRVLVFYLKNLFAPSLVDLSLYHDDIRPSRGWLSPPTTLPSLALLAALLWLGFALRTRVPLASLGILWFFAGHTIESSFLPLELAHDHRNYLPSFGIVLAVVALIMHPTELRFSRATRVATLFGLAGVLGIVTLVRTVQWGDEFRHALTEAHHHPDSPRAVFAVGHLYARFAMAGSHEMREPAYAWLERASVVEGSTVMPESSLIIMASRLGDSVNPIWLERIREKLRHQPAEYGARTSLQQLVRCAPQECVSPAVALEFLDLALENRASQRFPVVRADYLALRGELLVNVLNDINGAEGMFREAMATMPAEPRYRLNLIKLLMVRGKADDAAAELETLEKSDRLGAVRKEVERLKADLQNLKTWLGHADSSLKNLGGGTGVIGR